MKERGQVLGGALIAISVLFGASEVALASEPKTTETKPQKVGNGWARAYITLGFDGNPLALGISLDKEALEGLPQHPDLTSRCFDKNGNGKIDPDECIGDYNFTFVIPDEAAKSVSPFKWVILNWNPHGHSPPAPPAWSAPHFDFHFYLADREAVKLLRPGACGEFIDCADFKKATKPVPAKYIHRDHIDVGAAVPDMGNHLINSKSPELAPNGPPFTHTFIFGAYDGQITFLEPMITRAYIASNPTVCEPIRQPEAWQIAGSYPTRYCIRYLDRVGKYTVSLEDFVKRSAN
jgi:hypothetical protein